MKIITTFLIILAGMIAFDAMFILIITGRDLVNYIKTELLEKIKRFIRKH